jgi:hypothetical protein
MPKENIAGGGGSVFRARFSTSLNLEDGTPVIPDPGGGPWKDRMVGGRYPGSLAADGVISDLDTAPGYTNKDGQHFNQHQGTILFWAKPGFDPEYTGFNRIFFSVSSYDMSSESAWWCMNLFGIGYMMHHSTKSESYSAVSYAGGGSQIFKRSIFNGYGGAYSRGYTAWRNQPTQCPGGMADRNNFNGTPPLNHRGHPHDYTTHNGQNWGNSMVRGRWIHVAMVWNDSIQVNGFIQDFVNGTSVPWLKDPGQATGQNLGAKDYWNQNCVWSAPYGPLTDGYQSVSPRTQPAPTCNYGLPPEVPDATKLNLTGNVTLLGGMSVNGSLFGGGLGPGQPNPPPIRLGCVGRVPIRSSWAATRSEGKPGVPYPQNFPASATTLDEVLIFSSSDYNDHRKKVEDVWKEGRYYKSYGAPSKSSGSGAAGGTLANYTSGWVRLSSSSQRLVPPVSPAPPPPGSVSEGGGTVGTKIATPTARMGLIQYTMRLPNYADIGRGFPTEFTAGTVPTPAPKIYFDILDVDKKSLLDGSAILGYDEPTMAYIATAGGGAITRDGKADGQALDVDASKAVRYRFWLDSGVADTLNEPYTATPIVDDVTVTFARPQPEILGWVISN